MALFPKTTTVFDFEHADQSVTVDKVAPGPTGYAHYVVRIPTDIADRYDWRDVEADLDVPGQIDVDVREVSIDTGHIECRSVDANGVDLPGDTSKPDARAWAPRDVKAEAKRFAARVADAEREVGALWEVGSPA